MKIPGYTLHGDYYLANDIIINTTWKQACEIKQKIVLPNGKIVVAHSLSKKELEAITQEERGIRGFWYWTSSLDDIYAWAVNYDGNFGFNIANVNSDYGGARLCFRKNEIKQFLDVE